MLPYYIFFMYFGLCACLDYLRQDEQLAALKKTVFMVGFFMILFFVGFRYKIGSDWRVYIQLYEEGTPLMELLQGHNLGFSDDFTEPGYKLFAALFRGLGFDFGMFVFVVTFFNAISLYIFIAKSKIQNKLSFLAVVLILTTFLEFDILRQSLAFHIVLYAFISERLKVFRFLGLTVLAMMFHYTAVVFFAFYFFQKLKVSRLGVTLVLIIYFISLFVTLPVITAFLELIEPFVGGVLSAIIAKGQSLIKGFEFSRNVSFTSLLNLGFLFLLARGVKDLKLSATEWVLVKMFLFYILLNATLKEVQEVADRFSYYFNFGIAFMFALLTALVPIRERKQLLMLTPLVFILLRLFLHFKQPPIRMGQTPYRNYFFVNESDERIIKMRYDLMIKLKVSENEGKQ